MPHLGRTRRAGRSVALLTATLLAVPALGGCGGRASDAPAADPSAVAASPSGSASPAAGPASPGASAPASPGAAHAVADPGPLRLPLRTADVLLVDDRPLTPRLLERIRGLKGVQSVTSLSIAKVSIENRALTLAAVDAASYRRLTPQASAQAQSVWRRVAGGEIAALPGLRKTLPIDREGYLRLGNDDSDARLHVGAYAPQVPSIDLVVNESWGRDLRMPAGNAVVVSTGIASPTKVRGQIRRLAPAGASVQGLDAVARYGLDPGATQTAFVVGSVADAVGSFTYSVLGGGRIAPAPAWVASHIGTETMPIIGRMTCNTKIFPQLRAALLEIQQVGLASKIFPGQYAGCYYPRFIAGTTTLSNHSFGLAFDVNVPGNQRGTVGQIDRGVVAIFKKWGFAWGGDWNYTDPMHFELARLVAPR
ncbi:M15 family metallopeptidase [Nocardioides sp. TRM66260-LWL]|uniref:M15 family metallopeptidase n=1 Tax=Nocardioides sp. TRM66260-LWL TaxID=2874478 RepID=UPI001CC4F9FC|nr:M15 family metallopeptidase [Nocardioides sp. TRM66260-LWL]MBZ5735489.1 M15 family metallopeptidase [Nocardioides sp. TRM66260-LWL]